MDTSKIIKGAVSNGRYTVTAPIIKEDYGLYLQIEGVELPSTYEVDFSNSEHNGTSVTMIGNSDGVLIPHQFIDTGKDIFAFLYHVGADFGRTVYKFRIPNKVRPDRTEEEPTPEEQSVIDQAINALNGAVAQTAQDVIDADASAQSAQGYAEQAETAKSDAQTFAQRSANSAQASADYSSSAQASATASAQSAQSAEQTKTEVEDMVDDAQGYANASAQSASDAQGYAQSASASAQSASGYASSAQTSAQTASSKATEASGYASTASEKASEASQSATNASQSAQTAEQAKTSAQTAQGLAESARDSAQGYAEDAQGYAEDARASAESISASASQIAQNTADIASLEEDRYKPYVTDSASGSIASFPDGADNLPLKSLIVNIDPVQDLSQGDPSPTNLCPISGWTGCNVTHFGKNCISNGADRKTITTSLYAKYTPVVSLEDATSVTFSVSADVPSGQTLRLFGYNGQNNSPVGNLTLQGNGRYAITSNGNVIKKAKEFRVYSQPYTGGSSVVTTVWDCSCVVNEIRTDYIPYQGQTFPISWQTEAGTVYGGKLDVLSGKLTVYPYYASYNGETLTGEWISDRDVYAVGTTPTIGAQVVNIGAEGTEIQLEPHEVNSLLGANNIFADTGDCSVEYRADTKLYIERLTAPDSADMIADANITSGQFFMVGNSLYRALANIASGATITVGTNAQRVSLSDALNLVNT